MARDTKDLESLVLVRVVRLNAVVTGLVTGLLAGLALFVATNWLVLKGGGSHEVGPHLSLLAQYFLGYSVTFVGSLVGFVWAFACGLVVGYAGSWLYNAVARFRHQRRAP